MRLPTADLQPLTTDKQIQIQHFQDVNLKICHVILTQFVNMCKELISIQTAMPIMKKKNMLTDMSQRHRHTHSYMLSLLYESLIKPECFVGAKQSEDASVSWL